MALGSTRLIASTPLQSGRLQPGRQRIALIGHRSAMKQNSFGGAFMDERPHSWLALVAFCGLTIFTAALGLGVLFAGGSAAFAVAKPSPVSDETRLQIARVFQASGNRDAGATVAQPTQLKQNDEGQMFAGMITDSNCGARHSMKSGKSSAECARSCVRSGAHYLLVDGEKSHLLDGDVTQFEKQAGERVEVVGVLEGDTIRITSTFGR